MKKAIIITLLLFVNVIFSQKRELGKVTVDELKEKVCPSDSSAPAAVLFNIGEVRFEYLDGRGFLVTTRVRTKIKIYKKVIYSRINYCGIYW